jgi:hypothetical protein
MNRDGGKILMSCLSCEYNSGATMSKTLFACLICDL